VRIEAPETVFHVTCHGVDDRPVFTDDVERQKFVARLGRVVQRYGWSVYAVCLMTTHYHLIVELSDANLSAGMSVVNGGHARLFNERHERRGPVFERRFWSELVETDEHLADAIRYVALNPVEAGIVERPQDWPWSTYGQLVGVAKPWPFFEPALVLPLFSDLRSFVESATVPGTFGARH
jgi:REP element-mobilizing transposase RayT